MPRRSYHSPHSACWGCSCTGNSPAGGIPNTCTTPQLLIIISIVEQHEDDIQRQALLWVIETLLPCRKHKGVVPHKAKNQTCLLLDGGQSADGTALYTPTVLHAALITAQWCVTFFLKLSSRPLPCGGAYASVLGTTFTNQG